MEGKTVHSWLRTMQNQAAAKPQAVSTFLSRAEIEKCIQLEIQKTKQQILATVDATYTPQIHQMSKSTVDRQSFERLFAKLTVEIASLRRELKELQNARV